MRSLVLSLYGSALFLSAMLLFSVQPMMAKMLLPFLGGTPAVWNTCMVIFQSLLLVGYGYAHLSAKFLRPATQGALHLCLLVIALATLPLAISQTAVQRIPVDSNPTLWLVGCLVSSVGLPFILVSTTSPLLQKWFSNTAHPKAKDPYFLYAAGNLGSLLALVGYPLLIEPTLRLAEQSRLWTISYGLLVLLIVLCWAIQCKWRANPRTDDDRSRQNQVPVSDQPAPSSGASPFQRSWRQPVRWIIYAFVPSSLMLGVTTYLTTDIASIPLLWILPLSLYLLSLVLVFSKRSIFRREWMARALPFGAVGLTYLLVSEATHPIWLAIALHLLFFFIAAMVCHGRLADARPPVDRLTDFYFWTSVGGVLGGLFNTLVAPVLFTRVMEYPIAIVLACLLRPALARPCKAQILAEHEKYQGIEGATRPIESRVQLAPLSMSELSRLENLPARRTSESWACKSLDIFLPVGLGLLTWLLALATRHAQQWPVQVHLAMSFGLPAALSYTLVDRPRRFALAIGAVLLASVLCSGQHGRTLHAERNFFGVLRVTMDPDGPFRRLVHGNTTHGRQAIDPARQDEPLAYYHRTGPLGQIFASFNRKTNSAEVAVVGLGMGSMLAYAEPRQHWTVYEINPAMVQLARTTNYFSFVTRSRAESVQTILGDARLRLREAAPNCYDMIVLDAFSSDAIPLHLVTREALELYVSKLAAGGLLAFHISNRCLDLAPVLGNLAAASRLVCLSHDEIEPSEWERALGKEQSHWLVMARSRGDLGRLVKDSRWIPISGQPAARIWTDDFSNVISVFKWQ